MKYVYIFLIYSVISFSKIDIFVSSQELLSDATEYCIDEIQEELYSNSPLAPCSSLDVHWIDCEDVAQLKQTNNTDVGSYLVVYFLVVNV